MLPDNPSCHKDKSTGLMRREETGRRPLCKSCCRWLSLKKLALIPCYNASVASQSQVCRKNGHTRMKGKVYCRPCYNAARHQGSSARFFEPGLARKPKTDSAAAAAATAVQVGPDLTSTPFAFPDPASPRVPPTESPLSNPEDAGSPRSIQAANLKRSRVSVDDDETDEGTIKLEGASNAGQAPARKVAKHHYNFQSLSTGLKAVAIDTDISNSNLNDQWTTLRKKLSSTVVQHLQDFDQDASRTADSSPRIVKAADPPQSLRHAYSAAFGNSDVSIYPTTKGLGAVIGYLIYDLVFSRALDIIRLPEKLLCDVEAEATHWGRFIILRRPSLYLS